MVVFDPFFFFLSTSLCHSLVNGNNRLENVTKAIKIFAIFATWFELISSYFQCFL